MTARNHDGLFIDGDDLLFFGRRIAVLDNKSATLRGRFEVFVRDLAEHDITDEGDVEDRINNARSEGEDEGYREGMEAARED
jgi:hypothetical protein